MNVYWIVLFIACAVEIAWAISMKLMQQYPSVPMVLGVVTLTVLNMVLLSYAMRGIPVGTAYAIWTGLGAVGVTLLGVVLFGDPVTTARVGFLAVIIVGVVGLKAVS